MQSRAFRPVIATPNECADKSRTPHLDLGSSVFFFGCFSVSLWCSEKCCCGHEMFLVAKRVDMRGTGFHILRDRFMLFIFLLY